MKKVLARRFIPLAISTGIALTINIASVPHASAQQPILIPPQPSTDQVYSTSLFWGVDLLRKGYNVDAGFVHALNKNNDINGWLFAITGGYGEEKNTKVTPHSSSKNATGSALVGYQWVQPTTYFALFGGVHVVDINENPPGGPTDGSKTGVIALLEFETRKENSFYVGLSGSVSSNNDEVSAQLRVGYQAKEIKFGPEFAISDDKGGNPTYRYGAFISGIQIGRLSTSVSVGYNEEAGKASNDGFYAKLEFSTEF